MGLGVLCTAPPMRGGIGEGTPSPRAQQGRPNGWSISTIREVLKRPLYRGKIVYGKTRSAYGRELASSPPGRGASGTTVLGSGPRPSFSTIPREWSPIRETTAQSVTEFNH